MVVVDSIAVLKGPIRGLARSLAASVSPGWSCLLLLLLFSFLIAKYFGALIEDLQLFLFPLMLLIFWRLPKNPAIRMPLPFFALAGLLWLSTTAQLSGVLPSSAGGSHPLLSRLEEDHSGLQARGLYQQLNLIAKIFDLPKTELLHRNLDNDAQTRGWFRRRPLSPFILRGDIRWLRAVFPFDSSPYFSEFPDAGAVDVSSFFRIESQRMGLDLGKTALAVRVSTVDRPLAVLFLPEALTVPDEPPDLGRHFLSWLAKALERFPVQDLSSPQSRIASRHDALFEASEISGHWKTHAPLGLAHYLMGTLELLEALSSTDLQPALVSASLESFGKASSYVRKDKDPELYTAIFNNAAIAQLIGADSPKSFKKAKKWLAKAARTPSSDITASLGSRAALLNLMSLDSSMR